MSAEVHTVNKIKECLVVFIGNSLFSPNEEGLSSTLKENTFPSDREYNIPSINNETKRLVILLFVFFFQKSVVQGTHKLTRGQC